jgi:hypothetical protein
MPVVHVETVDIENHKDRHSCGAGFLRRWVEPEIANSYTQCPVRITSKAVPASSAAMLKPLEMMVRF